MTTKFNRIFIDVGANYNGICKLFAKYGIDRYKSLGSAINTTVKYLEACKVNNSAFFKEKILYGAVTFWGEPDKTLRVLDSELEKIIDWLESEFEMEEKIKIKAGQIYEAVGSRNKYRLLLNSGSNDRFSICDLNTFELYCSIYSLSEIEDNVKKGYWKLINEN